jgi:hypothetical protein
MNYRMDSVLAAQPAEVLRVNARNLQCDFRKRQETDELVVEAFQGAVLRVRIVAGPGHRGVKVTRDASGLRAESY